MREVSVEIRALAGPAAGNKYYLLLFEVAAAPREAVPEPSPPQRKTAENAEIRRLKDELARTKEYLQAINQRAGNHQRGADTTHGLFVTFRQQRTQGKTLKQS
jgi:hypothetical protein